MTMSNRVWCAPFNPGPVQRATRIVDDFKTHIHIHIVRVSLL